MIKVVLFDADGLIFDQERFSTYLERVHNIQHESMLLFFNGPFQECIVGNMDLREAVVPFLAGWGWNEGVDAFLKLWFERELNIDRELFQYIKNLRSKGVRCFVATNQEKRRFQFMLEAMNLAEEFDGTYASAHLGYKKPDVKFFEKIFPAIKNVEKEEVLFWDNKEENVKGARDFGFNSELYTTFEKFKEKMQEYSI